ncbi:WD40-repeat-containing domain protein [Mycena floridula]|nr:WD40-repeat-containing domain protein [Mycena floridula]
MKNSPFGKRLRASHQDGDEDSQRRTRQRTVNPIFGIASSSSSAPNSTPDLDSRPSTGESSVGPETPLDLPRPPPRDYGDRFVPSRDNGDLRTSFNLMEQGPSTPKKNKIIPSESDALKEQANALFTSILHAEVTPPSPHRPSSPVRQPIASTSTIQTPSTPSRRRLFTYNSPTTSAPSTPTRRRLDTTIDEAYSMSPVRAESRQLLESPRRQLRSVCKTPYRVLDAPDLAEDFYLNLVDWSSTNVLGEENDSISSVSWVQKGSTLAVGTLSGRLHVYDASTLQLLRTYQHAHDQRIGALAWNAHVLSSGSRDRMVHHRDVREATMRPFKRCTGHRQEVCGLKWSGDGGPGSANLASGGNDNKRLANTDDAAPGDAPLWKFHEHTAAVKALAWDPHVSGVLATGGGTQDKHIRFWNTVNGTMLNELDTGSQVCNLIWSLTSHELVSTHGFSSTTAQNQICIWKYPTLDMVASLTGHTNRVLYLAMSPDGETIVTGAGDETLRFWNAFPKKETNEREKDSRLDYGRLIR